MKKFVVLVALAGLLVGSLAGPAEAQKKKKKKGPQRTERTVEGTYAAPPLIIAGTCTSDGAVGCVELVSGAGEVYVTAKVEDAHGQPVFVSVQADTNGDAMDDATYGTFCGETANPLSVPEGAELHFWVGITPTSTDITGCQPAAATNGTVIATFSNLP